MNFLRIGAKNKIEIPTKINAIAQVLIQINRKLGLNPKLIETITNVTKKVVIKLIKVANLISSFVFNRYYGSKQIPVELNLRFFYNL